MNKIDAKQILELEIIGTTIPPDAEFFLDQFGECYAALMIDQHREIHPIKSMEFRRIIIVWLMNAQKKITQTRITSIRDYCEGLAVKSRTKISLYNRVACDKDGIYWLDLSDEQWRAVRISDGEWEISDLPPILFRRYRHMKPLSIAPEGSREDLAKFLALVNFKTEDDRFLCAIELATRLVPGIDHPIDLTTGCHGSAKSTKQRLFRELIDNSEILLLDCPDDKTELVQILMHHYCPAFDNVHTLQQWQSDMFCRACTGEGFSKRALYTDDDDRLYKYKRCISINSINIPTSASDMLDRAIVLNLERVTYEERKTDSEIETAAQALIPKVLAYLCSTVAKARPVVATLSRPLGLPRLADFGLFGEAIARTMGYAENRFLLSYRANSEDINEQTIEGNIVGSLILALIEKNETWSGTFTDLLAVLVKISNERGTSDHYLPANSTSLSKKLRLITPNLLDLGVSIEFQKIDKHRIIRIGRHTKSQKLLQKGLDFNFDKNIDTTTGK